MGSPSAMVFATASLVTFNARGYPPSDVPGDPAFTDCHSSSTTSLRLSNPGSCIAHVVGSSMGAYAALHFALMYPRMAASLVVAGVGSGSPPADRAAFVADTEATARAYLDEGRLEWLMLWDKSRPARSYAQGPAWIR